MAGWIGYTLANELYDFIYRGTAISIGTDLWLRLLVSPSTRSGGGTETNYSGYARFQMPRGATIFSATVNGRMVNSAVIALPIAASLGNGDLVAFDIVNSASGAFTKLYNGGPISPAKAVVIGKAPTFSAGKLEFTF